MALTAVGLTFYLSRPMIDRNYGGVSCGFRWMFWLTPLWLLALVPALVLVLILFASLVGFKAIATVLKI